MHHRFAARGLDLSRCPRVAICTLAEPEGFEPSIGLYNPITV